MLGLRRRMKLGRLKGKTGDSMQGSKSPLRNTKKHGQPNGESMVTMANGSTEDPSFQVSVAAFNLSKCTLDNNERWMVVSTSGEKPVSRAYHAAAVIGSKMVVVGGDSGQGLLDDTQVLNLERLTWAAASPKVFLSPAGMPLKIPACKGHSLVSWGKKVLLIGGKIEPTCDKVSVWSFDVETECWSRVEAKGDIPVARGGHTVNRAGSSLILFGGEDAKGKKLNDLHMFDLKSSMWLPLHYVGTGPSPRCNHVAALHDDKVLFVFGGKSKSRILNDLYSLDFETMIWSRIKIQGYHPSPRAGCCGVLCGTKWYIAGGGGKKKRCAETLVFDVLKLEMAVAVASPPASTTINKGFSLVPVHHKNKIYLVAFGGNKKEPSNQVEILIIERDEHSTNWGSGPDKDSLFDSGPNNPMELASHLKNSAPSTINSVVKHSLASAMEHHHSARRSLSETTVNPNPINGNTSLRKQFHHEGDYGSVIKLQKALEDDKFKEADDCSQVAEQKFKLPETVVKMDTAGIIANAEQPPSTLDVGNTRTYKRQGNGSHLSDNDGIISPEIDSKPTISSTPSNMYQMYETKIAALARNNVLLEGQLAAALASRENTEKNLASVIKSRQESERRLADTVKDMELLKEKLASVELAQEEANSLSNIVHADNVKLEHDVAFLKAVLDDTQKELHSTRGVLAGERARAFQLQVEVFHLKQRLQSMENRAPTPRKPFQL